MDEDNGPFRDEGDEPEEGTLLEPEQPILLPVRPQRVLQDRLLVVSTVYHQQQGQSAKSVVANFGRYLQGTEDMLQRRIVVREVPVSLPTGWITDASLLVVQNLEGTDLQTIPTEEQKKQRAKRVVELNGMWLIHPGETFQGCPAQLSELILRCCSEHALVSITLIPA
jgi:hypothetical protein